VHSRNTPIRKPATVPARRLRRTPHFAVLILLMVVAACRHSASEGDVSSLAEEFVHQSLALSPSLATSQGYHEYKGITLDEQLDDYSPAGIDRARKTFDRFLQSANGLTGTQLPPESQADLEVIRLSCQYQLLELDHLQSYRHNPTLYVETIGNAVYNPFILNYAPESKRLAQITARIEKIPAFLATAQQNLVDSPEMWNQVAQEENQGNIDLVDRTVRARIPSDLKQRYDHAAVNALNALNSFNDFLENNLNRHKTDWRIGPRLYAEKFKLSLASGDTPQQALSDAEAKLQSIRGEMQEQAQAVYPKFFPGKTPPSDPNTLVSQVLNKIAQQHATPETYFSDAKRDLAEATQFVTDNDILAVPKGNNLQVIPTPEFMRGIYGVGGFAPAPALEPQLGAFYWITPFTPDMTPDRIQSKLREYNRWGLKILTIHEAMPGHYVQFEYANQVQPPWRRALRAIFANGPYVEGWAVYATEVMIDQGYLKTPEMKLTFGKQMLRVVSNTILDIKLQTMNMTDQEALNLMIKDTFQEHEEAEKKLRRAKLSSCQLPTYFVGWRTWDQLRDSYRSRRGSEFKLAEFHERALKEGGIPLNILNRVLLHDAR
jgi:uncharacterized protein (DUF885 family)